MGYIFDALNKRRGEQPDGHSNEPVQEKELSGPDLSDVMAAIESQANEADTPLRLADVELAVDSDNDVSAVIPDNNVRIANNETINEPVFDGDFTIDVEQTPALQLVAPPAPKAGLWSRLLGRHLHGKFDDRLVTMTSPASAMSEEYRSIRTSILARHENERHLVHTITSATPQEGKSITCVNLGLSFAELRNRKTIIIECDLRLPTFGKLLNCDTDRPGLLDYLRGEAKLSEVIQPVEGSSLHILPAGGRVSDEAVQLLSGGRMSRLIQALRTKYDHVLIDTPPVLQLADAGILGSQSEEVLLVARMRRTPRTLVEQAVNTLTSYNAVVSGIIATDNPRSRGRGYGYRYGYRYGYGYGYGYTSDSRRKRGKKRDAA